MVPHGPILSMSLLLSFCLSVCLSDQCLQSQQVKQAASPLFVLLWWKAGVNTARLEVHC